MSHREGEGEGGNNSLLYYYYVLDLRAAAADGDLRSAYSVLMQNIRMLLQGDGGRYEVGQGSAPFPSKIKRHSSYERLHITGFTVTICHLGEFPGMVLYGTVHTVHQIISDMPHGSVR